MGVNIPLFVLFSFLNVVFSLVNFAILKPLLDVLFGLDNSVDIPAKLPAFYLNVDYLIDVFYFYFGVFVEEFGKGGVLAYLCIIVVSSSLLANLFRYLAAIIIAIIQARLVSNLRNAVFEKVTAFHVGYFTENRKGDLMTKIISDVQNIHGGIIKSVKTFVKEPILLIGYMSILFHISTRLTLIAIFILPLSGFVISTIAKKLKRRANLTMRSLGEMTNILDETISGIRIIKGFNASRYIKDKFREEQKQFAHQSYKSAEKFDLAGPISEFLGVSAVMAILYVGGNIVLENTGELSPSEFMTFLVFFSQVLNPAKAISGSFSSIQSALVSGQRVFDLMDEEPLIKNKPDALHTFSFQHELKLSNLEFAYEKEQIIKGISLSIKKGMTVALVGPSGGGKSTLADMIPRFYDPQSGAIYLDDHNIADLNIESYRSVFSIVTQESVLFNDTVFNNIAFGKLQASLDDVIQAAKVANAHEFISKMDDGYNTMIGERGAKLSGGQRQRLSIARAVLKNPEILILDEATSALDSESERLVQDALNKLTENRTSIVIAHRLSTIQNADLIVVLKDGMIAESGSHQELLELGGLYKKLTEMQSL